MVGRFPPRIFRRVPFEGPVKMRFEDGTEAQGRSMNISLGGMFIATETLRPIGTTFAVEFRLSEAGRLIQGQGRVLWTREEPESEEYPRGVGVRFLELTPGSRELIFEVVDQHVRETDSSDADSAADRQRPSVAPAVGALSLEEMPEVLDPEHPATLDAAIEEAVDREMESAPRDDAAAGPAAGLARVVGDEKPVTPADFARPRATGSSENPRAGGETAAWAFPAKAAPENAQPPADAATAGESSAAPFAFGDAPPEPLTGALSTEAADRTPEGFGDPGFGDSRESGEPRTGDANLEDPPPADEPKADSGREPNEVLGAVDGEALHQEPSRAETEPAAEPPATEPWDDWHHNTKARPKPWYTSAGALIPAALVLLALLALGWWFGLRDSGTADDSADSADATVASVPDSQEPMEPASRSDEADAESALDEAPAEEVIDVADIPETPGDEGTDSDSDSSADSAADSEPAETELQTSPANAWSDPARVVTRITWERRGSTTEIVVWGDGALPASAVRSSRIGGANPRQLIRLIGIEQPFADGTVEVGSAEVARVRTGHHAERDPDELHIVVDLAGPAVELVEIAPLGDRLSLRFRRP